MKLVLLPGLDGTGKLFKPFIDALPANIECVVISYPLNKKLSYEQLLDLVIGQLPQHEFVLLAESFSGPIAYQITLRESARIKLVILIASFLAPPRCLLLGVSRMLPKKYILSLPLPKLIIKSFLLGHDASEQIIDQFKQSLTMVSASVLSFRLAEVARLPEQHQACEVDALYLQASNDRIVPPHCTQLIKRLVPNIRIVQVNGPHFLLQASPLVCAKIISSTLQPKLFNN